MLTPNLVIGRIWRHGCDGHGPRSHISIAGTAFVPKRLILSAFNVSQQKRMGRFWLPAAVEFHMRRKCHVISVQTKTWCQSAHLGTALSGALAGTEGGRSCDSPAVVDACILRNCIRSESLSSSSLKRFFSSSSLRYSRSPLSKAAVTQNHVFDGMHRRLCQQSRHIR